MANEGNRRRLFSERTYAVPFGRYQPGGDASPQANEVLVGREGQRAYFIDLLFRRGRRGAFLVTGHRGVGKTVFVKHCLEHYRSEVFERFLHSRVGRATFWDRIGVMLLGILTLFAILMLSEAVEVLTLPLSSGGFERILLWILLAPLAILCVYPLLYAREVFREIFRSFVKGPTMATFSSLLSLLVIAAVIWFAPPFGAPALSMSRFFLAISAVYLWVQSTSFSSAESNSRRVWWGATFFFLALVAANIVWAPFAEPVTSSEEIRGNAGSAVLFLAVGVLLRSRALRSLRAVMFKNFAPDPKRWYFALGIVSAIAALSVLVATESSQSLLLMPVVLCIVCLPLFFNFGPASPNQKHSSFGPPPALALGVKAVLSIVVALQLVHPLLALVDNAVIAKTEPKVIKAVKLQYPSPRLVHGEVKVSSYLRTPLSLHEISGLRLQRVSSTVGEQSENQPKIEAQPKTVGESVFHGTNEELTWLLGLFASLGLLYFMEYEWVVRPFARQRLEGSLGSAQPSPEEDQDQGLTSLHGANVHRELAQLTMPWVLYKTWLPVLTLSVNLGFEKLDHRRVVYAMLAGLRDQYQRVFLSWSSSLANLGRIVGLLLLLLLVNLAGDQWFEMPDLDEGTAGQISKLADNGYKDICSRFQGRQVGAGAVNLICKLPWSNTIFHVLYHNLLDGPVSRAEEKNHLLFYIFPYRDRDWPPAERQPFLEKGLHLEIYHILLFSLFFLLGRWFLGRFSVFPYREALRRIDEVLDNLSARTSVTSRSGHWEPVQMLQGLFVDEKVRQTEQDPSDPRTVEFLFLQILRDIQHSPIHLAGAKGQLISLPTPEITFVFDELDKLGTRIDPTEGESSGGSQQVEILHAERKRSMELHGLLADMKNLLSSAPARFIFVGGRNLHDEWLADQTARQPLLTNIFDAEVYLPSLLTDFGGVEPERRRLDHNVRRYLDGQLKRARNLQDAWKRKHDLPSLALPLEDEGGECFVGSAMDEQKARDLFVLHAVEIPVIQADLFDDDKLQTLIYRDFCQFLGYRSVGNPKRLKELLGTFVRPVERVVKEFDLRRKLGDCEDVLAFGDTERFRVQLLSRIYRNLTLAFEKRLVRRDDKLVISVFFLADFLFKFHRRAFSWSNLERVDELVHIHRAPDLREVLEAIVSQWSERFLHPIRNGMYDFRFRSDLAREVEYISRQSHEEMAAFNFTLDESQALKAAYGTNILFLKERIGREPRDMVAGLGELHEFDQEYEEARAYYRRSIELLDEDLTAVVGRVPEEEKDRVPPVRNILSIRSDGPSHVRMYMTWGIARLRLMLQIGMTYERARDLERALVEYRNAHTLASSLLLAMLDDDGRAKVFDSGRLFAEQKDEVHRERLHALKHLNLLFQPFLAEAWVAEKLTGGVDTSISLVEKELWELRNTLPFVRDLQMELSAGVVGIRNSNFSLIAAELHSKAGDLYFFKGRQRVTEEDLARMESRGAGPGIQGLEGYLLRAHYHYSVTLHELRRFVTHRRASSQYKLNVWPAEVDGKGIELWPTISPESWPDYVYRSAGGTFNDIAEEMLGRVSLYGLLCGLKPGSVIPLPQEEGMRFEDVEAADDSMIKVAIKWMESATFSRPSAEKAQEGRKEHPLFFQIIEGGGLEAGTFESWLGEWTPEKLNNKRSHGRSQEVQDINLVEFRNAEKHDDCARLLVSLHLKLVGIRLLEKGGYLEDAAHELLGVCEIVSSYFWWLRMVERLKDWRETLTKKVGSAFGKSVYLKNYLGYLMEAALYSLRTADKLFQRGRRAEEEETERPYLVGNKVPVAALVLACSLGLAAAQWKKKFDDPTIMKRLKNLLDEKWHVIDTDDYDLDADKLREILKKTLVRHSYPMINRLHGLKTLIDDHVLDDGKCTDPEVPAWIEELLELAASLDAPMHFTPQSSGVTCAMACFQKLYWGADPEAAERRREVVRRAAQRDLHDSEEMFTLRRAYYENISDLAYLYDDFNDRQIHFNHAMQMAGAEINGLLMYLVSDGIYFVQQTKVAEE